MTYLPSLLKKIDKFCQLVEDSNTIKRYAAPPIWDDPNFGMSGSDTTTEEGLESAPYFDELVEAARQIDDPELSEQLQVLAELYRYSLQIGGGYATIAKAINNLKNMYGDGSDSNIEDILNGMTQELAKAAGGVNILSGKDNPSFVQRLAQLKQDIESRTQGRSEALDAYHEEIGGQNQGAQLGESEEDLAQAGLTADQADIVNPAALGFANKEDPKTNKGWHTVGNGKLYKNWKEHYANEQLAYEADEFNEQDPGIKKTLRDLIALLPKLSQMTQEALDLSNEIRSDIADPKEKEVKEAQLLNMRKELQKVKYARQLLRAKIRSTQLDKDNKKLKEEAQEVAIKANTSIDPERKEKAKRELELLKQKIALNELSKSTDIYKAKKRNYILDMMHQMSGGAWPSQEWITKQQQKIDEAKTVSKEEYDRAITEERGKQQARLETPTYDSYNYKEKRITPGGRRVPMGDLPEEQQINLEAASFSALVYQFQIDIASAVQAARQMIYETKTGKTKKVNAEYKSIVDEISEAIRKKDRHALYAAQTKLTKTVSNDLSVQKNQLKGYAEIIKLEPHFRKVLELIKEATKNKKNAPPKLDNNGNLLVTNFDDNDKKIFEYILNDIHRLRLLYARYYTDVESIKAQQNISPRYKKVISDMGRIEIHLTLNLHVHKPENKKLNPEGSPLAKEIGVKQNKEWEEKTPQEKLEYKMKGKEIQDKWDLEKQLKNSSIANRLALLKMAQRYQGYTK